MKKRKILLTVIAIIALCFAGEGVFASVKAFQSIQQEKSYEKKFLQTLQQLENLDAESFDNNDLPYFMEGCIPSIPAGEYIKSKELKRIAKELETLHGKLSAKLCADAFLDYDFKERAQIFLASYIVTNCYETDASEDRTAFSSEGDAFLDMLASNKIAIEAKEIILLYLEPSSNNQDKWDKCKLDILSESQTLEEFQYRLSNLFNFSLSNLNENVEIKKTITPKTDDEIIFKQCREWIDNPKHISDVTYIGAIQALSRQPDLTDAEKENLYSLVRTKFLDFYQDKDGQNAFTATSIISWLIKEGGWENIKFLQSMAEQFKSDCSLYSFIQLNALCETLDVQSKKPFIEQLKKDASPQSVQTIVNLLNLLCKPTMHISIRLDGSIYSYINRLLEQLPPEQRPLLLENNATADPDNTSIKRTADFDQDGLPDQEIYNPDAPGYYEVTFGCGDQLSYHFPADCSSNVYLAEMRDLNNDGKNEFLLFGYQWRTESLQQPQDDHDPECSKKSPQEIELSPHYFCLVMEKKEGSNIYSVVPTKSGADCFSFQLDDKRNQDDYSDNWISELNFS